MAGGGGGGAWGTPSGFPGHAGPFGSSAGGAVTAGASVAAAAAAAGACAAAGAAEAPTDGLPVGVPHFGQTTHAGSSSDARHDVHRRGENGSAIPQ